MALRDLLERSAEALWYARRGPAFFAAAPVLGPASALTWWLSRVRRHRARGISELPTLAIGNLAIGGTGKTQIALYLANRCAGAAIVTRGYGGRLEGPEVIDAATDVDACGDEPRLLAMRSPEVRVIVARDRRAGVALAKELGCKVVLLDDGLQQTDLEPNARIAVFGAEAPLGNGALLPLGPLRDPISALRPTDLVWLHGTGAGAGLQRVDVRSTTRPLGLVPVGEPEATPRPVAGQRLFAFAGIARPERFFETLREAGAELVGTARFADHRRFGGAELRDLARRAGDAGLVCTEKDAVRISGKGLGILALRTELLITFGGGAVDAVLGALRG